MIERVKVIQLSADVAYKNVVLLFWIKEFVGH